MKKICFVFLLLLTLIPLGVSAQQQMIQGRVLDDKGESIIGASVSVRGTVTGGITNLDGEFSVAGKVGDMLTISYIGYTPLEVKITKLTGNVYTLKEDPNCWRKLWLSVWISRSVILLPLLWQL